ncbi:MAG TPA: allophanate hydrolase subunit 1 [Frankiaceae bacterium]|nr:allophanate hydrolase subunit 1 [Frankiaceae bacterium]
MMGVRPAGERAAVLDCGAEAAGTATAVRELSDRLGLSLSDVVPGAATVLVVALNPLDLQRFLKALPELGPALGPADATALVEIEIRYDGPDLQEVADATGLDVTEVVRRHSAVEYLAAFTGFAPGFAYLTGLDPSLRLPRRSSPRPRVPPGSVAIADAFSAVYPRASPGGWHLLGSSDAILFDASRETPALLAPGSRVRFVPVG